MKLENKKDLASRALSIAKSRIVFNYARLSEIKEAITKQDMRDLKESGAIIIREVKGQKKNEKRKTRRRAGSRRKMAPQKKREYVIITRKLRSNLGFMRNKGLISRENYLTLRKSIRNRDFKSLANMNEKISSLKEIKAGEKNAKNTETKKKRSKN